MPFNTPLFHYTDQSGYNGISSSPDWLIRTSRPPTNHPKGAYFTTLGPDTRNLTKRLRIPRRKLAYMFHFHPDGEQSLQPLTGGRGEVIVYSLEDYTVRKPYQIACGATDL